MKADVETKLDAALREALENAEEGDRIRVIVSVEAGQDDRHQTKIEPSMYGSREDYRRALIQQRVEESETTMTKARDDLRAQALEVRGGGVSKNLVVEGTARDLMAGLASSHVRRAALDAPIELIRPERTQ